MRTSRIHLDQDLLVGTEICFNQAKSHYLRNVLRLKSGAVITLFNGRDATEFRATLQLEHKLTLANLESATEQKTESQLDSEIIQGLGRSDHIDWMIQKTTELGVNQIRLFNAERSQKPLKPALLEKKMAHWRGIAISACEQSGRTRLPTVSFFKDLSMALAASTASTKVVLEFTATSLARLLIRPSSSLSILVGPEGGLNLAELEVAQQSGFVSAHLGPRVLRTETAAVTALGIAQSMLGDL